MIQHYGGNQTRLEKESISITFRSEWPGAFSRMMFMPWHENNQKVTLEWKPGTDNSRLIYEEAPYLGEEWGLQNWATYTKTKDKGIHFEYDDHIKVNLSTYQYFFEAPFRLYQTNQAAYAGEQEWNGRKYDLVLVSWNRLEPQEDLDQYLLWIDQKTKTLAVLEYTVREFFDSLKGTMVYNRYQRVGGLLFPFELMSKNSYDSSDYIQRIQVEKVSYPKRPDAYFTPQPEKRRSKY